MYDIVLSQYNEVDIYWITLKVYQKNLLIYICISFDILLCQKILRSVELSKVLNPLKLQVRKVDNEQK